MIARTWTAAALVATLAGCSKDAPEPRVAPPVDTRIAASHSPTWPTPLADGHRLPFDGEWKVARTHYGRTDDQAYAVDLIVHAKHPRGKGHPNHAYPSYGRPLLASAPGVVAAVVDGIPDNVPGEVNAKQRYGNHVVIDHLNGEFSLYAHFIPGSIAVREGQTVVAGQRLGLCGNSGLSTMPHLHWQVMNAADKRRAKGVPIRLQRYWRNGRASSDALQKGDLIDAGQR